MNHLYLELDTTAPILEIFAPNYTTRSSNTIITIKSNEMLSSYQEIFIIDSENNRNDLTFSLDNDSLTGNIFLHGYSIGIAILYVRLKDIVENVSSLYSHTFYIMESEILTSEIILNTMDNVSELQTMYNQDVIQTMDNASYLQIMNSHNDIQTMKHETVVMS